MRGQSFRFKLMLLVLSGPTMVIAVGLALGAFLYSLGDQLGAVHRVTVPQVLYSLEMKSGLRELRLSLSDVLESAPGTRQRSRLLRTARTHWRDFSEARDGYSATVRGTPDQEMVQAAFENNGSLDRDMASLFAHLKRGTKQGDRRATVILNNSLKDLFQQYAESIGEVVDTRHRNTERAAAGAELGITQFKRWTLLSVLLCALASLILGGWLLWRISRVLQISTSMLSQASERISLANSQLNSSSQQLAASSSQAAASLVETVSSLEEISNTAKSNAESAQSAAEVSSQSSELAEKGEVEIEGLTSAIAEISEGSKKIEEIITVIDDIAFQTNLLALNAAVEAARAGEQGKGFAVVADAVRSLAQKSASSAKDIADLIKDSTSRVDRGTRLANETREMLKSMVESVKKVADINQEIFRGSQEQSEGIAQINKVMGQLDVVTQGNAAMAEEAAATAEELNQQSATLKKVVASMASSTLGDPNMEHSDYLGSDGADNVIPMRRESQTPVTVGKSGFGDTDDGFSAKEATPPRGSFDDF